MKAPATVTANTGHGIDGSGRRRRRDGRRHELCHATHHRTEGFITQPFAVGVRVKKASFADMDCSVARALEVDRGVVDAADPPGRVPRRHPLRRLRQAPRHRPQRAHHPARHARRRTRSSSGCAYEEAPRARYDYRLTDEGPAPCGRCWSTLRQWGDEWIIGKGNEPVLLEHTTCGHTVTAHLACDHCGERLLGREVRSVAGPGLSDPRWLPAPLVVAGASDGRARGHERPRAGALDHEGQVEEQGVLVVPAHDLHARPAGRRPAPPGSTRPGCRRCWRGW